ncbi:MULTISPECIES: hypothetical protein [unclassified Corynebacterium]|uniref:hypothetical protein n=1 Tax=unclassified Corynebacterium TaxID=2624378 RepID=UPI0029C9CCF9|nr:MULTISPECIES: hypothetical protein [unclassified Corynebacterium]WPF65355.1 hypothetical protein OLX12_07135 [Corynebacterium sp. 22KM0430]WPF67850.1 hypothetical protein OLW90_07125 [Corynebacterium sp. 21KM1197]
MRKDFYSWVKEYIADGDWPSLYDVYRFFDYDPFEPTREQIAASINAIFDTGKLKMMLVDPGIKKVFLPGEVDVEEVIEEVDSYDRTYSMMAYFIDVLED